MLSVKTENGFELPSKIYYKNGSEFVEVKKVYSSPVLLERSAFCSCETGLSQYLKTLTAYINTLTELSAYETGEDLTLMQQEIAELKNESESVKLEQVLLNQQIEIIDNSRYVSKVLKPSIVATNKLSSIVNSTTEPQIVVKIVPGSSTVNPDVYYGTKYNNVFKYDGFYYYIGNQIDQENILQNITNVFGENKVALQVFTSNQMLTVLRGTVKSSAEVNINSLNKIIKQQNILDTLITARKQKVNIDSSLENENTDLFVRDVYGVASIMDVTNTISNTIKLNAQMKIDNLTPATRIDVKTPLFPFTITALEEKTNELLGFVKTASNLKVSSILSTFEPVQIYTSSDIYEFDFKRLILSATGVKSVTNILGSTTIDGLGSGWVLVAKHSDNTARNITTGEIDENAASSIMDDTRWLDHKAHMHDDGMAFVDEYGRISRIKKSKLLSGNVKPLTDTLDTDYIYHDETSGNDATGLDYSIIHIGNFNIYGASLYNMSSASSFDIFPYASASYKDQNTLKYYVRDTRYIDGFEQSNAHSRIVSRIGDSIKDIGTLHTNKFTAGVDYKDNTLVELVKDDTTDIISLIGDEYHLIDAKESVKFTYGIYVDINGVVTDGVDGIDIVSVKDNKVMDLGSLTLTSRTVDIIDIISPEDSSIVNLGETIKLSEDIKWIVSRYHDNMSDLQENINLKPQVHSRIISEIDDIVQNLEDYSTVKPDRHPNIITYKVNNPHMLSGDIRTEVKHPELSTMSSDSVADIAEIVTIKTDVFKYIISQHSNKSHDLQENLLIDRDAKFPFTVYQQNASSVSTLNKPIIETNSLDNYVVVVKNTGNIQRINPIAVQSTKVPNYISTQTNADEILEYSLSNTTTTTYDARIVSQLNENSIARLNKPTIETSTLDLYVAEAKSVNVINFGEYVEEKQLESDVISALTVAPMSISFSVGTKNIDSDATYIVSNTKSNNIAFGSGISQIYMNENIEEIISVTSTKVVDFEDLVDTTSTIERVVTGKSTNTIVSEFSDNVDSSIGAEYTPIKVYNGELLMAEGIVSPIVVKDLIENQNYKISNIDGIVYNEQTNEDITMNNYVYDEYTGKMYKLITKSGYLDIQEI